LWSEKVDRPSREIVDALTPQIASERRSKSEEVLHKKLKPQDDHSG
jgi:hypothetical protein